MTDSMTSAINNSGSKKQIPNLLSVEEKPEGPPKTPNQFGDFDAMNVANALAVEQQQSQQVDLTLENKVNKYM